MDRNAAKAHAETLVEMKHRVRTAFGDSEDQILPLGEFGGTGQGSGDSPY